MKFKNIAMSALLAASLWAGMPAFSTELPVHIKTVIKNALPDAKIRFDGLIELGDGTQYLPVIPLYNEETRNPENVLLTIPEKSSLAKKPDFVLFEDNFALFKVIKRTNTNPTIIQDNKIPLVVKMGLLPQDLLVPEKLEIPYDLKIIMGDLKIPIKKNDDGTLVYQQTKNEIKSANKPKVVAKKENVPEELKGLKGNIIYATNIQSNKLLKTKPDTGRVLKTFELPSIYNNLISASDDRYILITCLKSNKITVFDTYKDVKLKDIELDNNVTNIMKFNGSSVAFAYQDGGTKINVIDLKDMSLGYTLDSKFPISNLAPSEDDRYVFYNDKLTGNIYRFDFEELKTDLIANVPFVSDIRPFRNKLLVTSRKDNNLYVYDVSESNFITNREKEINDYREQKNMELNNTLFNFITLKKTVKSKVKPVLNIKKDDNEKKKELSGLCELDKTINVGLKPLDIKISKDRNKVYILCAESNQIYVVDTITYNPISIINLGKGKFPKEIVFLENLNRALVLNYDSFETTILDLDKESVIGYLPSSVVINALRVKKQAD